jgi:glycosyltransferase involved in cell wall biosynthesis
VRIAYVINSVEGGGAALPVPAVAGVLQRQGARVEVLALTRRDGRALPAMRGAGLRVRVREGGEKDHWAALGWLDAEIAALAPDLIWTSLTRATLLGQLVGRRRRIPVVSWQHAAYLKPANRILLRATQRLSCLWIGDSTSVTALTAQRLAVPAERLAAWPLFAADPHAPQAAPWRPGVPVRLGALGRLHPVKGYDVLIAALARLRAEGFRPLAPFEVRIAGDGAERGRLEAAAAEAGLDNLWFTGFEAYPREFLAGLHLYLQPSRSEGLCIAVHEAMQAGLPALVSAVGELPYSVCDGVSGLVVPPADPGALAQALGWLLSHPERLAAMGAAARERVLDRFGPEAFDRAGAEAFARLPLTAAIGRAGGRARCPARPASGPSASRRSG